MPSLLRMALVLYRSIDTCLAAAPLRPGNPAPSATATGIRYAQRRGRQSHRHLGCYSFRECHG